MRAQARLTWTLGASLLALASIGLLGGVGCKSELDDTPVADPLDDPWVDAFDEDEAEPVAAEAEATPVVAQAERAADPNEAADPGALPGAGADPVGVQDGLGPDASGSAGGSDSKAAGGSGATVREGDEPQPTVAAAPAEPSAVEPGAEPPASDPAPPSNPALAAQPPTSEPAKPKAPAPLTVADLHGQYRFVGGSSQRADLAAAIDKAVDALPAAFRGIGRKRLTKTNPIDDGLEIVVAGTQITTIFSTGFDAGAELDGPTVHWTSKKGDKYKVRVRAKGSKLVQSIQGDEGIKTSVFVLSADKNRLTVHHKITADRLPEPVTYRLSYTRK